MSAINYLEWIGYIGSVTIAISLMMSSMLKLRWTNLIGALIFTIYGIAIHAIPVALVNGFIVIIDAYYLFKIYTNRDAFELLEVKHKDAYLLSFLHFHDKTIKQHFPDFKHINNDDGVIFFILRNMIPAGVFMGKKENEDTLTIELDFATPQYQDFKTGRSFFIENPRIFKEKGFKTLEVRPATKALRLYYKKMGFTENDGLFRKEVSANG